ncbi:MAG: hypothetical protein K2K02_04700 [Ruminococcus sp.]|nr:hypothetical protein [Ruminococcus sp.]
MKFKVIDNRTAIISALESAVENTLEEIGMRAEDYAIMNAPVGTPASTGIEHYRGGSLRNSITHKVVENSVHIGTNITSKVSHYDSDGNKLGDTDEPYGLYVELGTGVYADNNKGRKSPWVWTDKNGKKHWTKGIKPTHFLRNSISKHMNEYKQIVVDGLKNIKV